MGLLKSIYFLDLKNRKTNHRSGNPTHDKYSFLVTFLLAPNTNSLTWFNSGPNYHTCIVRTITIGSPSIQSGPVSDQFSMLLV
jgi:hypothetical protein